MDSLQFVSFRFFLPLLVVASFFAATRVQATEESGVTVVGKEGPGAGKNIVLISGDEEYRSEEGLPQLAKILAEHHGFRCTVLFAIDPADGTVNPNVRDNIPGLEALDKADLLILLTRYRTLPDAQMKHIADYVTAGKPVIGLRTATHAFVVGKSATYEAFGNDSKSTDGGFGRQVLGEKWINHHGQHGKQSTRGVLAPQAGEHPIVRGIKDGDIWGPTDVYAVRLPLPDGCQPLVMGQVLTGMKADSAPVVGGTNDPMMPVAWARTRTMPDRREARSFTTTMGASQDLQSEGLRRLIVNACYWALGMENQIPAAAKVDIVGEYHPTPFGFNGFQKGKKPAEFFGP